MRHFNITYTSHYNRRHKRVGQSILGSERFVSLVKEKFITNGKDREIADIMGGDYSTVSQGKKRQRDRAEKDQKISQLIERISKKCQD